MSDQNDRDEREVDIREARAYSYHLTSEDDQLIAEMAYLTALKAERARGRAAEPQGREFWIDPDKHDGLQAVFTSPTEGCTHVREVPKPQPPANAWCGRCQKEVDFITHACSAQPPASEPWPFKAPDLSEGHFHVSTSTFVADESYQPDKASYKLDKTADEAFRAEFNEWCRDPGLQIQMSSSSNYFAAIEGANWGRDYGKRESSAELNHRTRQAAEYIEKSFKLEARIAELEALQEQYDRDIASLYRVIEQNRAAQSLPREEDAKRIAELEAELAKLKGDKS